MFRPYGLDPADPDFDEYLAKHWGLDYNNGEPDLARAKVWYEEQKLKLQRELENQRQLAQRQSAPAPVATVPPRRRRRPA
ncbi:MAG: hypothetical protein KBC95_04130 [Candidatus Peribacteraceae bacterium]|nr:hypothetical protein [Candidatus Peribacteraceae bacterium]